MQTNNDSNTSNPVDPVHTWSDTESAWSSLDSRNPRFIPPARTVYPPSVRYGYHPSRSYQRYRQAPTDFRGTPLYRESSSSVLWQLTATLALVVLVFCSYQSDQQWASKVRAWSQFTMAWDYPVNDIVHWVEGRVTNLIHPHAASSTAASNSQG